MTFQRSDYARVLKTSSLPSMFRGGGLKETILIALLPLRGNAIGDNPYLRKATGDISKKY